MSFDVREKLRIIKTKANLYNFIYKGDNFTFTDHDIDILSGALVYKSIYIKRSTIKGSNSTARSEVEVTVGNDNEISKLFRLFLPSDVITLIIKEIHVNNPEDAIDLFFGEVIGCEINDDESTITALPINVLFKTKSARQTYQANCNHILYKNGCKLNINDFKFSAVVLDIYNSGKNIKLSRTINFETIDPINDNYLKSGIIITNNSEYKTILSVTDTLTTEASIEVLTPLANISIGDTVYLAPGCNRTSNHCKNKFNNFNNYRGFEFIPNKNPFDSL